MVGLHYRRAARLAAERVVAAQAGDASPSGPTIQPQDTPPARMKRPDRAVSALMVVLLAGSPAHSRAELQEQPASIRLRRWDGVERSFADLGSALRVARDGDTIRVDGGTHLGPFVVRRAINLLGQNGAVLDGGGQGTVITFTQPGARLTGFTIRGSGGRNDREDGGVTAHGSITVQGNRLEDVLYGISIKTAPDSVIVDNMVTGRAIDAGRRGDAIRVWESPHSRIASNVVTGARDVVMWYSEGLEVRDNVIRGGRYGLHYMYCDDSVIRGNRLERNSVGAYIMYSRGLSIERNVFAANHGPSGYGLGLKDGDDIRARNNVLVANRVGLYLDNSPARRDAINVIQANTLAYNDIGIALLPGVQRNRFEANNFIENFAQVGVLGGGSARGNEWTPDGIGNYWSDYVGYDSQGDGVGDVPHEAGSVFHSLLASRPEMALFALSPAQSALELASRTFPVFRPPAILADTAPRTVALPPPVAAPPVDLAGMLVLSGFLLSAAGSVVAWAATAERHMGAVGRD
jgi:nitrous oxidase accessory protein